MLASEITFSNSYHITWGKENEKYGGIYSVVEIGTVKINNNKDIKFNVLRSRLITNIPFVAYFSTTYYIKVYGFRNILDGSMIYLFENTEGILVLPNIKNGCMNYKQSIGMKDNYVGFPIGNPEFLHTEGKSVNIKKIIPRIPYFSYELFATELLNNLEKQYT